MNAPVFITGASGFIGGKIAERLLAEGRSVRVLARRPLPDLEKLGAVVVPGDLHDLAALRAGAAGAETVFHVAGRVGVWGPAEDFIRVNVKGTFNVVVACREAGVRRLVYTSSPSVVYNGGDLSGINETAPLCTSAPCAYPTSKAAAERIVLGAHGPALATVALRPHLVWGSGDKNVVPRVLALAKKGRLKIIGAGRNKVDVTHITNVVDAHLLAERALVPVAGLVESGPGSATPATSAGGKAYFITNGEPVILWDWINELLRGVGIPEVKKHVSLRTAYFAGGVLGEPLARAAVERRTADDALRRQGNGHRPLVRYFRRAARPWLCAACADGRWHR